MNLFHGTNKLYAKKIKKGKIDVNLGGGELGKGFYIGDLPHQAFNWAWHRYKKNKAVVKLEINDDDIILQKPLCLNYMETNLYRRKIKIRNQTKTFLFNENLVWAPIVGKNIPNFNQIKIESDSAENLVNSSLVIKTIL